MSLVKDILFLVGVMILWLIGLVFLWPFILVDWVKEEDIINRK